MSRRSGAWRHNLLFGLLMVAVVAMGARLAMLIRDRPADAVEQIRRQQEMVIPLPARPGNVYARTHSRNVLLAGSRQVPSCFADPALISDSELPAVVADVADVLDVSEKELLRSIERRRQSRFVWLAREISESQADAVRELSIPAVGIIHEWRRSYPNGELAGNVIGFRRIDGVAGGGLELALDDHLQPQAGREVLLADASRRPIWPLAARSDPPRDGRHVFTTLDMVIQGYLTEAVAESVGEHHAQWGTGIVINPQTGEILAMCSVPGFDPNSYNTSDPQARSNRAVSSPFEPGSVLKPVFAAAAVQYGEATYDTRIFCENGVYHAHRGGRISDHGHSYGELTVAEGVIHSSNILMAKLGERIGNRRLFETARQFGFGSETSVPLPGESPGIIRPLENWDGYSTRRVPFGQEISVTTVQLAMAFGAIANGGLLMEPVLIDHVTDASGEVVYRNEPRVVRRVLSPEVSAETLQVLRRVVTEGTGKACRLENWSSFGKTGTAQVAGEGGYVDGAYVGSFVGGAPASDPKLLCVVSIYRPDASRGYYGSKVAAPYVRRILEQSLSYLDVPPDIPEGAGSATAWTGR
ncbi:MAG: peptidoglycan D,D-transpeptidase FtsI family protein [Phycisphaerae bacterium]